MMEKKMFRIVGGAVMVAALAVAAATSVGSASAQPLVEKVGIQLPARDGGGHRGPGKNIAAVATALGLTEVELKTQLGNGKSLANVATAQGVQVSVVINVIKADITAHIAQKVAAGTLTQAEADVKLAEVNVKVTEMVNAVRPAGMKEKGGPGRGHGGRHGFGKPGNIPTMTTVVPTNS